MRSLWERAVIYRLLQSKEGNKIGLGWVGLGFIGKEEESEM